MSKPIIDKVTPNYGWPSTSFQSKFIPGTRVIITGKNFFPPPKMHFNKVTFAGKSGQRLKASIIWAFSSETQYEANEMIRPTAQTTIGQIKAGSVTSPQALAVSKYGLYVSGTVLYWRSPGGIWGIRFYPFKPPHKFDHLGGIGTDEAGNVYLSNSGLHRIEKYDMSLGHKALWGSKGSGNGNFNTPRALSAVAMGKTTYVFIADVGNLRVVRTKDDGSDFRVFAMPGNVGAIHGIAAHAAGDVYCSDPTNRRILHYDSDGKLIDFFGTKDLSFPLGVDVDFDGFIYVADNGDRLVKKFDSNYNLIAQFGLTPSKVPLATPPQLELVDPVDVAVTDDKSVYIADRARNYIIQWTPKDSQELHVDVPEEAVTGAIRVEVNSDYDEKEFTVWQLGSVSVNDFFVSQGIEEYPMVVRKRTAVMLDMSIPLTSVTLPATVTSFWGHPAYDRVEISVKRNGVSLGKPVTKFDIKQFRLDDISKEARFTLLFSVPEKWVTKAGNYEFSILVQRAKQSGHYFKYQKSIAKEFKTRSSLNIGAVIISHLTPDGLPATGSMAGPWNYYSGNPTKMNSWVDKNAMLSGFAHYNRLFPSPHSLTDVLHIGQKPTGGLTDGISDSEVKFILKKLESLRGILNQNPSVYWKFIIGIVDRAFTGTSNGVKWSGITSAGSGYYAAIVSIEKDADDVGSIIAHEIAHQYFIVRKGSPGRISKMHSNIAKVQSSRSAWNSLFDEMVTQPISPMVTNAYVPSGLIRNDFGSFFPAFYTGKTPGTKVDGDYIHLFNDMPNPHSPENLWLEVQADSSPDAPKRPDESNSNLTLIGTIGKDGKVTIDYCYVGEPHTPITPRIESKYQVALIGKNGNELLTWPIPVSFELLYTTVEGIDEARVLDEGLFRVSLPFVDGTRHVKIWLGERVIHTIAVPEGSPEINIISPAGVTNLGPEDEIEIKWNASHPDEVPLLFHVEYSPDAKKTYQLVEHGISETSIIWRNWSFPGGEEARIRVTACDGFHRIVAESEAFRVARKNPSVYIIWPKNGQIIPEGQRILMAAVAEDPEDGILGGAAITWLLDTFVVLGNGKEFILDEIPIRAPCGQLTGPLPIGKHTLTARAVDSDGNLAEDSITIVVAQDSDGDGYTDDEEFENGTNPKDPFDNPGIVRSVPFGQWQFSKDGTWTRFELSNLTPRPTTLEIGFIQKDGQPLQGITIEIQGEKGKKSATTDSQGHFTIQLGGKGSAIFALRPSENMESDALFGFGTIRLIFADGSTEGSFLAHGWIRHPGSIGENSLELGYEGTVVINGGKPFTLRAPLFQSPKTMAMSSRPIRRIQDLGSLIHAASKGVVRSMQIDDVEESRFEKK